MLVTCQRFGDLFLFGLVWQYSSVQTKYNKRQVQSHGYLLAAVIYVPSYTGSALKRELYFCNCYLSLLYFWRQATQKRTFGQKCTVFWGKWLYSFFLPNKENILSTIALRLSWIFLLENGNLQVYVRYNRKWPPLIKIGFNFQQTLVYYCEQLLSTIPTKLFREVLTQNYIYFSSSGLAFLFSYTCVCIMFMKYYCIFTTYIPYFLK